MSYGKAETPCLEFKPWPRNVPLCGNCAWEEMLHPNCIVVADIVVTESAEEKAGYDDHAAFAKGKNHSINVDGSCNLGCC